MKKGFIQFLTIVFVFACVMSKSFIVDAETQIVKVIEKEVIVSSYDELKKALISDDKNVTIVLDADIYATEANKDYHIDINNNKEKVVIDMNNHMIRLAGNQKGLNPNTSTSYLFDVPGKVTLYVINSGKDKDKNNFDVNVEKSSNQFALFSSTGQRNNGETGKIRIIGDVRIEFISNAYNGYVFMPNRNKDGDYSHNIDVGLYGAKISVHGKSSDSTTALLGVDGNFHNNVKDTASLVIGADTEIKCGNAKIVTLSSRGEKPNIKLYNGFVQRVDINRSISLFSDKLGEISLNGVQGNDKTSFTVDDDNVNANNTKLKEVIRTLKFSTEEDENELKLCSTRGHMIYSYSKFLSEEHNISKSDVKKEATCVERGTKDIHCDDCDKKISMVIDYLKHDFQYYDEKAADCYGDGNIAYCYCNNCKKYYPCSDKKNPPYGPKDGEDTDQKYILKKTSHNVEKHAAANATCDKDGWNEYYQCKNCQAYFNSVEAKERKTWGSIVIPAIQHKWDNGKLDSKTGTKLYTCTVCKKTKTESSSSSSSSSETIIIGAMDVGETYYDDIAEVVYTVVKSNGINTEVSYTKLKNTAASDIVIPNYIDVDGTLYKVTEISDEAFANKTKILKVKIGTNVTKIGKNAFNGCKNLKSVNMNKNITTIGDKAFYKCKSLTNVTIPYKVTKIGKSAFEGCKKLKKITIKTTKLTSKKVGSKAFKGIHSKAKVKVPKMKVSKYKAILKKKGLNKKTQKITK